METEIKVKTCSQCGTQNTKKWYSGPICKICYNKNYYIKNKKRLLKRQNLEEVKRRRHITGTKYIRNRYTNDLDFRLKHILRSRLCKALKNNYKTGSAVKDLGCSINKFRKYIENRFKKGMTWDNYGKWHIDHIKPLCKFNLTIQAQLRKACHYTNLQPLWAKDNMRKGGKYNENI